jgi:molybdopterin biosynthesis enzyme
MSAQKSIAKPGEKLNPPHGQPGHDCKVPVGAPLPAGSGTSSTQPAITQFQQPSVTLPQQMPAQKSTAKPGEKLNPPHGQPGHDCKIPVGAPLK